MASGLFGGGGGGYGQYRANNQMAGIGQAGIYDSGLSHWPWVHENTAANAAAAELLANVAKNEARRANEQAELLLLLEDV